MNEKTGRYSVFFKNEEIEKWEVRIDDLARLYNIPASSLSYYHLNITSDFAKDKKENWWPWTYQNLDKHWWIAPDRFGKKMCVDEKSISWDVYTIFTNPEIKKPVAIIPWVLSSFVIQKLKDGLSVEDRKKVQEISMDMSPTMESIVNNIFSNHYIVTDRFHVMKNVLEDLNAIKIRLKTTVKKEESENEKTCKNNGKQYSPERFMNWETKIELIQRASYQLVKRKQDWKPSQIYRRSIIKNLPEFAELVIWYWVINSLYEIYDQKINKIEATKLMDNWLEKTYKLWEKILELTVMANTINNRKDTILNYFHTRHSNGYAEWFNSKIQKLISSSKGFRNKSYTIYRIIKMSEFST